MLHLAKAAQLVAMPQCTLQPAAVSINPSTAPSSGSSGSGVAALASPSLAALAVTARELLQDIEAAAAESSVESTLNNISEICTSSQHGQHKNSSSPRRQLPYQECMPRQLSLQAELDKGCALPDLYEGVADQQLRQPVTVAEDDQHHLGTHPDLQREPELPQPRPWPPPRQLQQQEQHTAANIPDHLNGAQPELDVSSSLPDSVRWSLVLQKYQLHKMHVAELMQNSQQQQQQPKASRSPMHQQQDQTPGAPTTFTSCHHTGHGVLSSDMVDACAQVDGGGRFHRQKVLPLAAAPAVGPPSSASIRASQDIWPGGLDSKDTVSKPGGAAAAVLAMQAAVLSPSLHQRVQQLQPAGSGILAAPGSAVSPHTDAAADLAAAHGELYRVKAERGLLTALVKHLAAVVAADEHAAADSSGDAQRAPALTSPSAVVEVAARAVAEAEVQLHSTPQDVQPGYCVGNSGVSHSSNSNSNSSSCLSDIVRHLKQTSTAVASALARRQQQAAQLQAQLSRSCHQQQQLQLQLNARVEQANKLQEQLDAAAGRQLTAVQAAVAHTEARYSKKVIKLEAKLLGLAQRHKTALANAEQQLQQQLSAASAAGQSAERCQLEVELLRCKAHELEEEKLQLLDRAEHEKSIVQEAKQQALTLQDEQRSLLSALEALETALQEARKELDEQSTLRQRYESALENKTQQICLLKGDVKDARRAAGQAHGEAADLQQQLLTLKSKATETARQLSAARAAVKDAAEAQHREHQRADAASAAVKGVEAELQRLEKAAAQASKALSAETKRAAAAESAAAAVLVAAKASEAAADSLKQQLQTAKAQLAASEAAAADAVSVQGALREQLDKDHQQHSAQVQQLQRQLKQQQEQLVQRQDALADALSKAAAADIDLATIRSEVATWVKQKQQRAATKQPAVDPEASASPRRAGEATASDRVMREGATVHCSSPRMQSPRLTEQSCSTPSRPHSMTAAAAGVAGKQCDRIPAAAQPGGLSVPVAVARQLQQQAEELIKQQRLVARLQVQLDDCQQELRSSQHEHQVALQQLTCAQDDLRALQQHTIRQQPAVGHMHGAQPAVGSMRSKLHRGVQAAAADAAVLPEQHTGVQGCVTWQEQQQLLQHVQHVQDQLQRQQQRQQKLHCEVGQHQEQLEQQQHLHKRQAEAAASQLQLLQDRLLDAEERAEQLQQQLAVKHAVMEASQQQRYEQQAGQLHDQVQQLQHQALTSRQQQQSPPGTNLKQPWHRLGGFDPQQCNSSVAAAAAVDTGLQPAHHHSQHSSMHKHKQSPVHAAEYCAAHLGQQQQDWLSTPPGGSCRSRRAEGLSSRVALAAAYAGFVKECCVESAPASTSRGVPADGQVLHGSHFLQHPASNGLLHDGHHLGARPVPMDATTADQSKAASWPVSSTSMHHRVSSLSGDGHNTVLRAARDACDAAAAAASSCAAGSGSAVDRSSTSMLPGGSSGLVNPSAGGGLLTHSLDLDGALGSAGSSASTQQRMGAAASVVGKVAGCKEAVVNMAAIDVQQPMQSVQTRGGCQVLAGPSHGSVGVSSSSDGDSDSAGSFCYKGSSWPSGSGVNVIGGCTAHLPAAKHAALLPSPDHLRCHQHTPRGLGGGGAELAAHPDAAVAAQFDSVTLFDKVPRSETPDSDCSRVLAAAAAAIQAAE